MPQPRVLPSEEFAFKNPINPTDPIVYFDRKISDKILLEKYNQNSNDKTPEGEAEMNYNTGGEVEYDNSRITAKEEPFVHLDNVQLHGEDMDFFHLTSKGFYPELEIMVNDPTGKFFKNDRPNLNNKVTIVIIPKLDGKYKGIKLDFYIEDYTKISASKYLCKCKYNFMPFEKRYTKIIRNIKAITPTPDGETWLSTFDMIKTIALETGFGFQATKDCKDIFDRRRHFMQRENYLEFIPRQFEFAGHDGNKDEIFDIFIDIFGYFTMINLPFVFKGVEGEEDEKGNIGEPQYDFHYYGVWQESGTHREDPNTEDKAFMFVYRIVSNLKRAGGETNLSFKTENLKTVINNYDLTQEEGTLRTLYMGGPYGGEFETQGLDSFDTKIIGNSLEERGEKSADYEFTNQLYIGYEMAGKNDDKRQDEPTMHQKELVDKYKKKLHKEELIIELDKINFGLVRGTAIYVHVLEYDQQEKRKLLYNYSNLNEKNTIKDAGNFGSQQEFEDIANNESFGVPRVSLCGWYYITAVDYFYERGSKDIKQTLTLVRHFHMNDNNKINLEKIYTTEVY